jgi:MFS family permease
MIRSATDRKVEARRVALASAIGTTIESFSRTRNLQFSLPVTLGLLQSAAVVFAISILFFANRSDIIGRRRMMIWSCGILVIASLVFFRL